MIIADKSSSESCNCGSLVNNGENATGDVVFLASGSDTHSVGLTDSSCAPDSTSHISHNSVDKVSLRRAEPVVGDKGLDIMTEACKVVIQSLGEDVSREGLLKTPQRMAKALLAITSGYLQSPKDIVSDALFECSSEEMVLVRDIDCYSLCEHHMLPFFGKVHIGYIPQGHVVGLSKLARLTDCFAKRLQIQEKMTQEIAQAVHDCVGAKGVAVMIEATHMCMTMRGVEKPGSTTISYYYTGCMKTDKDCRNDFLSSVRAPSTVGR